MPLPNADSLIGKDLLRQFGNLKIQYKDSHDYNDEDNSSIKQCQQATFVINYDVAIPAQSIVLVQTELCPNNIIKAKAWVVDPLTELFFKKRGEA